MHTPSPSAHACTASSQRLPAPRVPKAIAHSRDDRLGVGVIGAPHSIALQGLCAGLLLALPCGQKALAAPEVHALHQQVYGHHIGRLAAPAGLVVLAQQPGTDWISRVVEFLSHVPPQCRAVAHQQPDEECQKRKKGVLEQLKHDHPVLFNLAVAAATFVLGFYITGGFTGGGK